MSTALRLGLCLSLVGLVAACSSDEKGDEGARTLGEPALSIQSLGGVANPSGTVEAELGCDGKVPAVVSVTNFALRPPDACFGYPQCGQIAVLIDPVLEEDGGVSDVVAMQLAVTSFVDIDFGALDAPEGEHLLRFELREDGASAAVLGSDGKPLASELRVKLTPAEGCDAGADGSEADASDDAEAASDADAG